MDEITLKLNSKQNYKNNIETNKFDSNNKLKELKDICIEKNLKHTGNKTTLARRIVENLE